MAEARSEEKPKRKSYAMLRHWKRLGFDKSYQRGEYVHVGCSECVALVVNGVQCHETGCPNIDKTSE